MTNRGMQLELPESDEIDGAMTPAARIARLTGAVRRRPLLAVTLFAVLLAACGAYYLTATPMYRAETQILTQRPQAVPTIGRQIQDEEGPTRAASELVHKRENLIALIKQTSLFADPAASAPARIGLLDRIVAAARAGTGPGRQADPLHLLVERLNKALLVKVQDGTITISIAWPDARQAYAIVEAAEQNFLEARHLQEITAMDEMISLLQGRTLTLRNDLDRVVVEESSRTRSAQASEPATISGGWIKPAPRAKSAELARIESLLDAKERAIRDVEEFRRRRLSELQAQLDEKRGTYSDAYPPLLALRQDIDALSRESPQIVALRGELRKLQEQERLGVEGNRAQPAVAPLYHAPSPGPAARLAGPANESERVRDARFQYQHMVEQLDAAKLDLDAARAAFKYRYSVIWPARLPTEPSSPNPLKVFGLGALAAALLALFGTAWVERRAGRIVEPAQLERELGLRIVGEIGRS
jgi:subunit length determinant Wzz-like protein